MRCDVIVAGAGPAGSTAARECAALGLSVVLLDRTAFPRDKPCGGGVNVRAARLLPFDLSPVTERTVYGVRVSVRESPRFARRFPQPLTYFTRRSRLDLYLVEQALRAGVTLRERAPVAAVERRGPGVVVRAGGETFEGRALVAADGANGPTAGLAGVPVSRRLGLALEADLVPRGGVPAAWRDVFGLDVGAVRGGYGWLFPKGDHLNVGVGGWQSGAASLRGLLARLVRFFGFDPADLARVRGFRLPLRSPGAPLAAGPVVVAGDAAGLLDPLTGDGIYSAIWSGRAAARHLAAYLDGDAPDLGGYTRELEDGLLADLHVASRVHALFHVAPGPCVGLIARTPRLWQLAGRIVRGDQTYSGAVRRLLRRRRPPPPSA